jgi:hypothetical protein
LVCGLSFRGEEVGHDASENRPSIKHAPLYAGTRLGVNVDPLLRGHLRTWDSANRANSSVRAPNDEVLRRARRGVVTTDKQKERHHA